MSSLKVTPGLASPFGPKALTTMVDAEPPSCVSVSGVAVTPTDSANSEGPVRLGTSAWLTVQPAALTSSAPSHNTRVNDSVGMTLLVPEVSKVHEQRTPGADFIADQILPVERDVRDR